MLTQVQAAKLMNVSDATVLNWEKGETEPPAGFWPAIMAFLGYEPFPAPATLAERMSAFRRREGLSVKEAAQRAGVDEASWSRWERTGLIRSSRAAAKLSDALGLN